MTARLLALAVVALAGCGDVLYDQNQRRLILEPVERVTFDSDRGNVEVYAFNRTAVSLLYYLRGAEKQIVDVGHDLTDTEIQAFIHCTSGSELCVADFYAEVPLGTEISATTHAGDLKLTGVDAPVEATIAGSVEGFDLRTPTLDLDVTGGDVTLTLAGPPERVHVVLDAGNVDITVPAGAYRCALDAADGDITTTGVTCDDAAQSTLDITVGSGDITLQVAS